MMIKNADGSYTIKPDKPGFEAVPLTGVVGVDLSGDGNTIGLDGPFEYGFGGSVVVAAYAGIMKALELVPAYRAGQLSRRALVHEALAAAWQETKDKAAYVIVSAVIISLLPGTGPIFALASVVGAGVMSWRLVKMFAAHDLDRRYRALVWGTNIKGEGIIDQPIGRASYDRKRQAITTKGRNAKTSWQILRHEGKTTTQSRKRKRL